MNANYDIQIKQCQQLEDPQRSGCKAEMKGVRNAARGEIDGARSEALDLCNGKFVSALRNTCEGVPE